jgi:perosamine synthetase
MFQIKRVIGQHKVFSYDTERYPFRKFLQTLYQIDTLEQLHLQSADYKKFEEGGFKRLEDVETDLQKTFYTDIKARPEFKDMYCSLVSDLYRELFPEEEYLVYQSFPSIRFQYPHNIAVPAHCDSDELGKHPIGEMNFLIPITSMKATTRLFLESEPKKGDFQGIELEYGELLFFNGNTCIHYNQENLEDYVRISFDFRCMRKADYMRYILSNSITQTNPRDLYKERVPVKMYVGGYYQCMFRNETSPFPWFSNPQMILQTRPVFSPDQGSACAAYFAKGDPFLTEFKETEAFERQLKSFVGAKHCFMTTSGSTALVVALVACGIGLGDDVLVPDYTMIATANAVKLVGANPILLDVSKETNTLSLETIKRALTPKTKAVLHVSLNNRNTGIQEIVAFCKEKGIYCIEDAAQSLGCRFQGQHYGTFGDIGCFSLSTPKIITTGQGGFVVSNNDELAQRMLRIKNFGRSSGGIEQYDTFGLNFKFTDIQAVIGQTQFAELPARVSRMRAIFDQYFAHLTNVPHVSMLPPQTDEWIPWFVELMHPQRDLLAFFLKQHNIGTRPTYPSIHLTEPYADTYKEKLSEFETTNAISTKGLFLPTHFLLTDNQIEYICRCIRMFNQE